MHTRAVVDRDEDVVMRALAARFTLHRLVLLLLELEGSLRRLFLHASLLSLLRLEKFCSLCLLRLARLSCSALLGLALFRCLLVRSSQEPLLCLLQSAVSPFGSDHQQFLVAAAAVLVRIPRLAC